MIHRFMTNLSLQKHVLNQGLPSNEKAMNIANATYRTPGWTAETEHFPPYCWWSSASPPDEGSLYQYVVGKTIINHPFGNGLYTLFMVIWGMVYTCFTHIIYIYIIIYIDPNICCGFKQQIGYLKQTQGASSPSSTKSSPNFHQETPEWTPPASWRSSQWLARRCTWRGAERPRSPKGVVKGSTDYWDEPRIPIEL